MTAVVIRGFFSRRLRAFLTGIAVALGVALMSGTYILTDTIDHSFSTIFATGAQNRAVVVVPHQGLGANAAVQTATIGQATLERVRRVPGVAVAAGEVFAIATLFNGHGKRLNTSAPSFAASLLPPRFEDFSAVQGHLPTDAGSVAIDEATAQRESLKLGQRLRVAGATAAASYRIVGILRFAGSTSFGGAGVALVTVAQAQLIAGEPHAYDDLVIAARAGVSPATLRARIRAVLPRTLDVRTGLEEAAQQTSDLESQLGFLRTFLLIFAYVALFVGAFIIFNTFSITVAQRTREFGLLRTLGATRGQVVRSVVAEGVMLGFGGALVGLLAGFGLAPALDELFKAFGADLPDSGTVIEFRTVWVSLLAGTAVTVVAGLLPALRAARVTPIAAMREGVALERTKHSPRRRRIVLALVALYVLVRLALLASSGAGIATIVILAAIILAVRVPASRARIKRSWNRMVVALAHLLARPFALRGITGRLARDNTVRHPGPHRRDRRGADDRPRAGQPDLDPRGRHEGLDQQRDRRLLRRQPDHPELGQRQQQRRHPDRHPGGAAQRPRRLAGHRDRLHRGPRRSPQGQPVDHRARPARASPRSTGSTGIVGSDATLAALGTTGTVLTKSFASAHHLHVGQTLSVLTASGRRDPADRARHRDRQRAPARRPDDHA